MIKSQIVNSPARFQNPELLRHEVPVQNGITKPVVASIEKHAPHRPPRLNPDPRRHLLPVGDLPAIGLPEPLPDLPWVTGAGSVSGFW